MRKLSKSFYVREDTLQISKDLLGKFLFTKIPEEQLTGGIIVETEAYVGINDKACHAHLNRRTKRTQIMYHEGGVAYVYLCYGLHALFNIVTHKKDQPHAVLIRAIEPTKGIKTMLKRRNKTKVEPRLTAGPGAVSQALGIHCGHYGESLDGNLIWVEDSGIEICEEQIIAGPRVGINYAGEHALLPWRFRIRGSRWTSKAT